MIRLQTVQEKDKDLLWNINQKYLYEMTNFYDDPMDENGNFHYGHFEDYFTDSARVAYFIFNDDALIGFAMLCPYSNIGQNPDYTMAEFTIFPAFRRKHLALDAVKMILDRHQGKWEIKYNEKNVGAKKLWSVVAAPYEQEIHHLNEEETVLAFTVRDETEFNIKLQDTEYNCGIQKDDKWFRYRAAAIIVEDGCVLFAGNEREDYYYSIGGAVHMGETAEEAVKREVYEETGVEYEIDRLAVIHENFFNENNGSLKGMDCHEVALYYLMKPKGTQQLNSNSYTLGVKENMYWLPIEKLDTYKAFPSFMKTYLQAEHSGIEHIITDERA